MIAPGYVVRALDQGPQAGSNLQSLNAELASRLMRVGIFIVMALVAESACSQELIRELLPEPGSDYFGQQLVPLGDVDADGVRDLLIVCSNYGTYYQSGFVRAVSGRTGARLYEVRSATRLRGFPFGVASFDDDDGDGVRDFLVADVGVNIVSGRTGAQLRALTLYDSGTLAAVGDIDGDGRSEVAIGGASGGTLIVSGRTGATLWQLPYWGYRPWGPVIVGLGDVTGDGWADFALVSRNGTASRTVLVASPRESRIVWSLTYSYGVEFLARVPDQNNDGRPDLAVGMDNSIEVFSSGGASIRRIALAQQPSALGSVGDIDGDGLEDLAIGEEWQPSRVHVFSTRTWLAIYSFDPGSLQNPTAFAGLGDVNGDGRNDFAVGFLHPSTGGVRFYGPVPAGYREFGAGCAGTVGLPRLSAVNMPRVGERFEVRIAPVPPFSFTVFLLGASNTRWAGLTLPVDLGLIGMPTCTLFASGEASAALFSTTGTTGWSTTVPADYTLLRARFYNQAFLFDARANPMGVVATNGGEASIGG